MLRTFSRSRREDEPSRGEPKCKAPSFPVYTSSFVSIGRVVNHSIAFSKDACFQLLFWKIRCSPSYLFFVILLIIYTFSLTESSRNPNF